MTDDAFKERATRALAGVFVKNLERAVELEQKRKERDETPPLKPITVAELLVELQKLPPDAYVFTEGCDCTGPCSGAALDSAGNVTLQRDDYRSGPLKTW